MWNRILIGFSLVLNSFLLTWLFGVLPLLLFISVLANGMLVWYCRRLVSDFGDLREDLGEITSKFDNFGQHLGEIQQLEMFYGDATLESLMDHSRVLVESLEHYEDKYTGSSEEEYGKEE